jgi:hypothetical protein
VEPGRQHQPRQAARLDPALAGCRTDPTSSDPTSAGVMPAATAALEPPGVGERSHGLLVRPKTGLPVWWSASQAATFVCPMRLAPQPRSRAATQLSSVGTLSSSVGSPLTSLIRSRWAASTSDAEPHPMRSGGPWVQRRHGPRLIGVHEIVGQTIRSARRSSRSKRT